MHVIADAATSVLALVGGWVWGWDWLDPLMGVAGAMLVAVWAKGLIMQTDKVSLDREMDHPVVDEIREVMATDYPAAATLLTDLHVWRVGKAVYSCALSVVMQDPAVTPQRFRQSLAVNGKSCTPQSKCTMSATWLRSL